MTRQDFIRFLNRIWGEPNYGERLNISQSELFNELNKLPPDVEGRMINYQWVPAYKRETNPSPQEAVKKLEKKIMDGFLKGALEFDMDYFIYSRYGRKKHVVKVYRAYNDSMTGERKRVPGKIMRLEFLVKNRTEPYKFL